MKFMIIVVIWLGVSLAEGRRELSQEDVNINLKLKFLQGRECGMFFSRMNLPWMVSVIKKNDTKQLCDGVLIYPDVVITSAHCVDKDKDKVLMVTAKEVLDFSQSRPSDKYDRLVSEIHINPSYRACSRRNDFAILILSKPYQSSYVKVVCLPLLNESYYITNCFQKLIDDLETLDDEWDDDHCGDKVFTTLDSLDLMEEASCRQGNETTALFKKSQLYSLMCELDRPNTFYYIGSKVYVEMCGADQKGYWFYDTLFKYMTWIYRVLKSRIIDYDLEEELFELNSNI